MRSVINFASGPTGLPREVLTSAWEELHDWRGTGMSVTEMPFTGTEFKEIMETAVEDLRELMSIPDDRRVLFMHGGASAQFSAVPMNLLRGKGQADYVDTGHWAKKAIAEASHYCRVNVVASGASEGYRRIPKATEWKRDPDAAYCHIVSNETANGVEYHWTPDTGDVPLVADMSSNFLSKPIDVSRYGLIYACAQKNLGLAGLALVIVREDLMGPTLPITPGVFNYRVLADSGSRFNTPPTFAIYFAGLMLKWLKARGGLEAVEQTNLRKAARLYAAIDGTDFYRCLVAPEDRSRMNVCFRLGSESLEEKFLQEAHERGLVHLKGHSAVGGIRASLYNAMPEEGVDALIGFMGDFVRRWG